MKKSFIAAIALCVALAGCAQGGPEKPSENNSSAPSTPSTDCVNTIASYLWQPGEPMETGLCVYTGARVVAKLSAPEGATWKTPTADNAGVSLEANPTDDKGLQIEMKADAVGKTEVTSVQDGTGKKWVMKIEVKNK